MHYKKPSFLSRVVRNAPGLFAALMLLAGFLVIELGSPANSAQVASAIVDRTSEATANRSEARSGELEIPTTTSTTVLETTTTTAAPTTTTTAAPTTTTTAAPTTTTAAPAPVAAEAAPVAAPASVQTGKASYYAYKAGGCAHKTIPKGTVVTVTNTATGAMATCVVNDRGPFVAGRIIDLDVTVFKQLASTSQGVFSASISW